MRAAVQSGGAEIERVYGGASRRNNPTLRIHRTPSGETAMLEGAHSKRFRRLPVHNSGLDCAGRCRATDYERGATETCEGGGRFCASAEVTKGGGGHLIRTDK